MHLIVIRWKTFRNVKKQSEEYGNNLFWAFIVNNKFLVPPHYSKWEGLKGKH